MELKKDELEKISGGAIASSMINAITKAVNTIYTLGKQVGSSFRRVVSKTYCPVR